MLPHRDRVGRRPEQAGPEEAYRPTADVPRAPVAAAGRFPPRVRQLVGSRRVRLQAAGLAAIGLVSLLSFVLFPPRSVRVIADGDVVHITSRAAGDAALVERAGIELRAGDRVEPAAGNALVVRRATEVALSVDGTTYRFRTQAETVDELLVEAGVTLEFHDSIVRDGAPVAQQARLALANGEAVTLEVRRAIPFAVIADGQRLELRSSRETLAPALREARVRLGPGDRVQPPLDTALTAGLEVRIERAVPLVVTTPEGKLTLYSLSSTVSEALVEAGVALPPQHRLEPAAETALTPWLSVHVVGVPAEQRLEQERSESPTVYDSSAQQQPGGFPDGLEVAAVLRVYATWYNPASAGRSPSDPAYGLTATGVPVTRGIVAVDPGVIPLGTRLYIPGYGYAVASDTGGGVRGNMIDLGYPDNVAVDWTTRWVDIYILGS